MNLSIRKKEYSITVQCIALIFVLFVSTDVFGQQDPDPNVANQLSYIDILPPSPAVGSISDFGRVQSSLSSGSVQFNIPLTSISVKGVSVPIQLNYSSSGIKVDEIASRVGMGWQLNAGGSISRVMQGAVDENSSMLPIPSNPSSLDFWNYIQNALQVKPNSGFDTQPDLFSFDVCGLSGKFYLDSNNQPVQFPKTNLRIETFFSNSDYNFIITDTQGNQFFLGGDSYTEKSKRQGSGSKPFFEFYATAWFLKKIVTYGGEVITFHYKPVSHIYDVGANQTLYHTYSINAQDACDRQCPIFQPDISVNYVHTQTQYLDSIHAPDRSIKFDYTSRQDCSSEKLLDKFTIYGNDANKTLHEVFDFTIEEIYTTNYTNSIADQIPTTRYRPFLKQITRTSDGVTLMLNSFEYDDPQALPVRLSYAQDHWGYFNAQNNQNFVPLPELTSSDPNDNIRTQFPQANANREVNTSVATKGMLKKITYPTKGYDVVEYENNTNYTNWFEYPTQEESIDFSRNNSTGTNYTEPFEFTISFTQNVSLEISIGDLQPPQSSTIKAGTLSIFNEENILVASVRQTLYDAHNPNYGEDDNPITSVTLPAGTYHGSFQCMGKVIASGQVDYIPGALIPVSGNKPIGGLRVKSIKGYSFDNTLAEERHFEYCSKEFPDHSSLIYYRTPEYFKGQMSSQGCQVLGDPGGLNITCPELECLIGMMYSSSIVNLSPFSGNQVLYSHVLEYNGPNKDNGFTEHEYYDDKDIDEEVIYGEPIIGAPVTNNSVVTQNREKQTTVFVKTASGYSPLKRTIYEYTYEQLYEEVAGVVVNKRGVYCGGIPSDPPQESAFKAFEATRYWLLSPWTVLNSVRVENYVEGDAEPMVTEITYAYGNTVSKLPTTTVATNSEGKVITTTSKFANDVIPGITADQQNLLNSMLSQNIVTPLVYQEKFVDGVKTQAYRSYYLGAASKVYPSKVAQYAGDGTEIGNFEFMEYDANGNVKQQKKNDGVIHSYLWDYEGHFVVAEVTGAPQSEIAATSFEGTASGNWVVVSGIVTTPIANPAPTGTKCLSNGSIQKPGLTPGASYKVSYWYSGAVPVVTGGTISETNTVVQGDGWTSVTMTVTGASQVTVTTSGLLDEVRLHPVNALMSTFTYDRFKGQTSSADPNNIVTYYSYDELGRLKTIRDAKKNIVKSYEYHYK